MKKTTLEIVKECYDELEKFNIVRTSTSLLFFHKTDKNLRKELSDIPRIETSKKKITNVFG